MPSDAPPPEGRSRIELDPRKWKHPAAKFALSGVLVGLATIGLLWNTLFAQMPQLPTKAALWELNRDPAIEFVDANGATVAVRGNHYGRVIHLSDLPDHVTNAIIAAEDKHFRDHSGVDYGAILRATLSNARAGHTVSGASTITQQLVKNLFLTPDQTIKRKAQEARLAWDLEHMLTKDEILELYLNRTYFGAGAYGIDAAARTYFGVDPRNLTTAEAAMLAAFPKAPSRFATSAQTPAAAERQHYVLDQMVEAGFITVAQADQAKKQQLRFTTAAPDVFTGHALDFVTEQVHQILSDPPPDLVVKMTVDLRLQAGTQKAVNEGIAKFGAEKRASEGAALLIERTGAIRAMVGGTDYAKSQFNRTTQARRQPGSSFKMFVFAAGLEAGLRPGSVRIDQPISIGNWRPRNYGGSYAGPVTLSEALAESLNTIAAQIGQEVGFDKVTALAKRFGVKAPLHSYPSITLGSDEVTLMDMTTGYGVLALNGKRMTPYIVEEIRNSRGDLLYSHAASDGAQIYEQRLAEDMTGMLSGVVLHGTGGGARVSGWDVAGKTGTSQDWRDAWFLGYTTRFVGGVWVGNDNDKPMAKLTGGELPARIFSSMMTSALEGIPPESLPGAHKAEEFIAEEDQFRLTFYRRLSAAFASAGN